MENGLIDIVSERYDACVRLGELVAKDMIAVPISAEQRMIVVGSPAYLRSRSRPKMPQDLVDHACINLRLPTHGGLYVWEFEKRGRETKVRVEGQIVLNRANLMVLAALAGTGLAYLPVDEVQPHIAAGRLVAVLEDWSPAYPGYHLYYPSRRQLSPAFALLLDALRYTTKG